MELRTPTRRQPDLGVSRGSFGPDRNLFNPESIDQNPKSKETSTMQGQNENK